VCIVRRRKAKLLLGQGVGGDGGQSYNRIGWINEWYKRSELCKPYWLFDSLLKQQTSRNSSYKLLNNEIKNFNHRLKTWE
jgi:hypothetical protein